LLLGFAMFASCNGTDYPKAENALDAGREFIDACLKGDFAKADFYMLDDADNEKRLSQIKTDYNKRSSDDKQQYKTASIIIGDEEALNDSTHIIHYRNSFDKVARKIKVIKRDNTWLVDFKYTFDGNL